MLYEKVFDKYDETNSFFRADLRGEVPDIFYWTYVNSMVEYLKQFYEMTLRISDSLYVTTNIFFIEVSNLYWELNECIKSADDIMKNMGIHMKVKFDKYWGDIEKKFDKYWGDIRVEYLKQFFASILYPTNKLNYLEYSLG